MGWGSGLLQGFGDLQSSLIVAQGVAKTSLEVDTCCQHDRGAYCSAETPVHHKPQTLLTLGTPLPFCWGGSVVTLSSKLEAV